MRIVGDTNVLVSGVLFLGYPRQILIKIAQGEVVNFTSPALLREAEDVLLRPKFGLDPNQVSSIIALFRDTFELVHPARRVNVITDDPSDNMVLETAQEAAADRIVSGDKHLLDLKEWKGIRVVSPAEFMGEIEGR
ncbi:MAG: putative toxin-antitoxin system toxin component, PIN family [Thermodesulfobacteriota bacterium]